MWLEYDNHTPDAYVLSGVSYHEVFVLITFRFPAVANFMRGRWKTGTEVVGENRFRSSFFTTNAKSVQKYLHYKKMRDDMVTPQDAEMDEVESLELEGLGIVEVGDGAHGEDM